MRIPQATAPGLETSPDLRKSIRFTASPLVWARRLTTTPRQVTKAAFWIVPTLCLFLVALNWTGITGTSMNLGGDDSHLMYAYPWQWLTHASIPTIDQNLGGYNARIYFVPFVFLIMAIRWAGLNAQGIVLGSVLALTFAGMARLTLELLKDRTPLAYGAALLAGVISVSAPLVAETEWSNLLTSIFWEPLVPWLILLFIWHQRNGGWAAAAATAGTVAVGAAAVNQIAWTIACGLLLVGLSVVAGFSGVYRFRPNRLLVLVAVTIGVNAFWVIPVVAGPLLQQAQITSALSATGKDAAINTIRAVAPTMGVGDALSLRHSTSLMESFGWPALVPNQWSLSWWWIGLAPVLIASAGILSVWVQPGPAGGYRLLLGLAGLAFIFLYLETLRVLPGGPAIFEFMTRTIPGWTAERNFYDKFAIPYVEAAGLLVGVAFYELARRIPHVAVLAVALIVGGAMVFYDLPFFGGAEFRLPYYPNGPYNRVMSGLPKDYTALLDHLRTLPPGAVLSLPLSRPAWTVIPSDSGAGAYIGLSPIFFLTGRDDYNGVASFGSPLVPVLSTSVQQDLDRGDAAALAQLAGELGVKYVVVNTQNDINHAYYRVGAVDDGPLQALETSTLVSDFAPNLIGTYGPFELRELAPSVSMPVVSLLSVSQSEPNPSYVAGTNVGVLPVPPHDPCETGATVRVAQDEYILNLPPNQRTCTIVLRRAFSRSWRAEITDPSNGTQTLASTMIYGFANSFVALPGSRYTRQVRLIYGNNDIVLAGVLLSLVSCACLAILLVGKLRGRLHARSRRPTQTAQL